MKQMLSSIFCRVAELRSRGGAANLLYANLQTSNSEATPRLSNSATQHKSESTSTPPLRNSATPLFIIIISLLSYSSLHAQTITAKQRDVIIIDNGAPGKADPGDRIMYDVTISNSGGTQGNNTQLNIVPDPRTTFVPGSFKSSPLALDDAYTCTGNVGINIPVGSSILLNDFDDNIPGLTVTAGTFSTTQGGSIMLAADGSFMYTPPAGFTGADTYVYTLNDGNTVGPPVPATNTGTITITVSNMIWFISNIGGGSGGAGTLTNPFKTIADFNGSAGPLINQLIFLTNTGTDYTNGIILKNGQTLFGSGHTGGVTLADIVPFTMAPNSKVLPAIAGTNPNILNTAGIAVSLASGNKLRGFNVGSSGTPQNGTGISGTGVAAITIDELSIFVGGASAGKGINIAGGGPIAIQIVQMNLVSCNPIAIDLSNLTGGTWNVSGSTNISSSSTINVNIVNCSNNFTFSSLNITNGGSHGLSLTGCSGNFTINGGTITNPGGTGVLISGGSVVFNSSGTITDNSGFAVDIDNHDSNNVTFSGNINSTGTGIRVQNCGGGTKTFSGSTKSLITSINKAVTLSSNAGATITFSGGGLVINSTSGTGFDATGGATAINVTGTGNTITSTSGTALNVVSTNIGASNLNFQSISKNGGANGIVLNNTGASGSLIVLGTGSANSGGTIQNTTSHAISLTNTKSPSFNYINIQNAANSGIFGTTVTNFTLTNSTINNVNTAHTSSDANVAFNLNGGGATENNISGIVSITDNSLDNSYQAGIDIYNYSGIISNLTITGNSFTSNTSNTLSFGSAISIYANRSNTGASFATIGTGSISDNTITNFPSGAGIQILSGNTAAGPAGGVTIGSSGNPILIQDNTITGSGPGSAGLGTNGIALTVGHLCSGYFTVGTNGHPNTITNVKGNGIAGSLFGTGTAKYVIAYNLINANNTSNSAGINTGADNATGPTNTPTLYLDIHNNNVSNTTGNGILSTIRSVDGTGNFYIQNNIVIKPTGTSVYGIRVDAGNGTESAGANLCLKISGNTTEGASNGSMTIKFPGIGIRQQHTIVTSTFNIDGLSPNPANDTQMESYVSAQNPLSVPGTFGTGGTASISSGATYHLATCVIP